MALCEIRRFAAFANHDHARIVFDLADGFDNIAVAQARGNLIDARRIHNGARVFQNGPAPLTNQFRALGVNFRKLLHQSAARSQADGAGQVLFLRRFTTSKHMDQLNRRRGQPGYPGRVGADTFRIDRPVDQRDNFLCHDASFLNAPSVCPSRPAYHAGRADPPGFPSLCSCRQLPPRHRRGGTSELQGPAPEPN